jgi:hypothetical protein
VSFGDVAGKSRSAAINQLVSLNTTQSVMKIVMQQQMKDVGLSDAFMVEIMWLLAQVAQRGNRRIKCNLIQFIELRCLIRVCRKDKAKMSNTGQATRWCCAHSKRCNV